MIAPFSPRVLLAQPTSSGVATAAHQMTLGKGPSSPRRTTRFKLGDIAENLARVRETVAGSGGQEAAKCTTPGGENSSRDGIIPRIAFRVKPRFAPLHQGMEIAVHALNCPPAIVELRKGSCVEVEK